MAKKGKNPQRPSKLVNIFVITGIVLFVLALILLISNNLNNRFGVNFDPKIKTEYQTIIRDALIEWDELHGCPTQVYVRLFTTQERQEMSDYQAFGVRGEIAVNPDLVGLSETPIKEELRDIALHEATHACKEPQTILEEPIPYENGLITSYQGIGFVIVLENGEERKYGDCEEALAEYNAYFFSDYMPIDQSYYELGAWMTYYFSDTTEVTELGKANDFVGFVSLMLGVPREEITADHLKLATNYCSLQLPLW